MTGLLLAVHIADGLLAPQWLIGGFLLAGVLALVGGWGIREEEIPRVALLTAAFFVASSIHVRVGPGSYHLLLSGLVGVVLGRRAALAILIGLTMQAFLLNHGGATAIGINTCIQILPALFAWQLFARLRRVWQTRRPVLHAGAVGTSIFLWALSLVFALVLLVDSWSGAAALDFHHPLTFVTSPVTLAGAGLLSIAGLWLERRLGNPPEFPLGLLIGELSVLLAVALKCVVLSVGGEEDWRKWALVELVGHLPIAVIEGIILGFMVGFLARVKPELLASSSAPRKRISEEMPCLAK